MPWEPLKLLNRSGEPLSEHLREIIVGAMEKTVLASPNATMEAILRTAKNVARNIDSAEDANAYTKRSFFRVARSTKIADQKDADRWIEFTANHLEIPQSVVSKIAEFNERQNLLHIMLEQLDAQERNLYVAHFLDGASFSEIDKSLKLKPGTSEQRYRTAKRRLSRG